MEDEDFEWDDRKAALNFVRHGVTFEAARGVFKDAFALEFIDTREDYGEDRFVPIGMAGARLLVVVYTVREAHSADFGARRRALRTKTLS